MTDRRQAGVPLTISNGVAFNTPALVQLRIGNDRPVSVILDTGSVGVRLFSNVVTTSASSGVTASSQRDVVTFADGSIWSGVVAEARVRLEGLSTAKAVPFELVHGIACQANRPECPAHGGFLAEEAQGYDGVLGIGLSGPDGDDPVTNPILSLPGEYGRSWSVNLADATGPNGSGELVLGAPAPQHPAVVIHLTPYGSADGAISWDDEPVLCWTIATKELCGSTIFDSGSGFMYVTSQSLHSVPTQPGPGSTDLVTGDAPVSVSKSAGASAFWSFDSGGEPGVYAVAVVDGNPISINRGVQAFFSLDFRRAPSRSPIRPCRVGSDGSSVRGPGSWATWR
jgi:Protein of unknown function (DUF3443)